MTKRICLGYIEAGEFEEMSESERNTMLDARFSYNDGLRKNTSRDSTTESVSEFEHRLPKTTISLRRNPR